MHMTERLFSSVSCSFMLQLLSEINVCAGSRNALQGQKYTQQSYIYIYICFFFFFFRNCFQELQQKMVSEECLSLGL